MARIFHHLLLPFRHNSDWLDKTLTKFVGLRSLHLEKTCQRRAETRVLLPVGACVVLRVLIDRSLWPPRLKLSILVKANVAAWPGKGPFIQIVKLERLAVTLVVHRLTLLKVIIEHLPQGESLALRDRIWWSDARRKLLDTCRWKLKWWRLSWSSTRYLNKVLVTYKLQSVAVKIY